MIKRMLMRIIGCALAVVVLVTSVSYASWVTDGVTTANSDTVVLGSISSVAELVLSQHTPDAKTLIPHTRNIANYDTQTHEITYTVKFLWKDSESDVGNDQVVGVTGALTVTNTKILVGNAETGTEFIEQKGYDDKPLFEVTIAMGVVTRADPNVNPNTIPERDTDQPFEITGASKDSVIDDDEYAGLKFITILIRLNEFDNDEQQSALKNAKVYFHFKFEVQEVSNV